MDWSYVAGFFDGEGHISIIPKCYRCALSVVQSVNQDVVLFKMRDFLNSEGVTCHLYRAEKGRYSPKASAIRTLAVTSADSIALFLKRVMPFLIVKRAKAEEALPLVLGTIERKTRHVLPVDNAIRDYLAGSSQHDACLRYGITRQLLRYHLRRRKVQIRPLKDAVRQFHESPAAEQWRVARRLDGARALVRRWAAHREALQPVLEHCRQEYALGASALSLSKAHKVSYPMLKSHLVAAGVWRAYPY